MKKQDVLDALLAMTDEQLAQVDQQLAATRRREAALRTYTEHMEAGGTDELAAAVAAVVAQDEPAKEEATPVAKTAAKATKAK